MNSVVYKNNRNQWISTYKQKTCFNTLTCNFESSFLTYSREANFLFNNKYRSWSLAQSTNLFAINKRNPLIWSVLVKSGILTFPRTSNEKRHITWEKNNNHCFMKLISVLTIAKCRNTENVKMKRNNNYSVEFPTLLTASGVSKIIWKDEHTFEVLKIFAESLNLSKLQLCNFPTFFFFFYSKKLSKMATLVDISHPYFKRVTARKLGSVDYGNHFT